MPCVCMMLITPPNLLPWWTPLLVGVPLWSIQLDCLRESRNWRHGCIQLDIISERAGSEGMIPYSLTLSKKEKELKAWFHGARHYFRKSRNWRHGFMALDIVSERAGVGSWKQKAWFLETEPGADRHEGRNRTFENILSIKTRHGSLSMVINPPGNSWLVDEVEEDRENLGILTSKSGHGVAFSHWCVLARTENGGVLWCWCFHHDNQMTNDWVCRMSEWALKCIRQWN